MKTYTTTSTATNFAIFKPTVTSVTVYDDDDVPVEEMDLMNQVVAAFLALSVACNVLAEATRG